MDRDSAQRLVALFGEEGVSALERATVLVIGLGGVGSNCAEALARGGIGHLVLVDRDVVEPSNINRQAVAYTSTLGRDKTDVMERIVNDINPACRVDTVRSFVTRDNLPELLAPYIGHLDYVVDAIDTMNQKVTLARLAQDLQEDGLGFPLVSAMGGGNKLRPELLRFADITQTHTCPLCKDMRKLCRKRGVRHLEVLFSTEVPLQRVAGDASGARSPLGTASFMPPIMGQMIAGHVICRTTGVEGGRDGAPRRQRR